MGSDHKILENRFKELSRPLSLIPTGEEPKLKKLEDVRFLIFDFYGTLFISGVGDIGIDDDTEDIRLFRKVLAECGFRSDGKTARDGFNIFRSVLDEQQKKLKAEGLDIPELKIEEVWLQVLQSMKQEGYMEKEVETATARLFAVEYEARMNPVWPMPALDNTLSLLREKDLQIGIISNSQFYTPIAFEALTGISPDHIFNPNLLHWSYEERLKKPSIEFYRSFLRKAERAFPGSAPSSMLYVGNDMLKDIYPASEIGMKTALFAGDQRSLKWRREDPRCRDLEPDIVITELVQLMDCL